jgi:glycosyltransferase involved in cell wall biosynthesis
MSDQKVFSIVIPAKNEEDFLPILLESIKKQNLTNYEVIVAVSPDTTDKTVIVAEKYGAEVVVGGIQATARNNGARVAKGRYLLFLDADTRLVNRSFLADLK